MSIILSILKDLGIYDRAREKFDSDETLYELTTEFDRRWEKSSEKSHSALDDPGQFKKRVMGGKEVKIFI